MATTDIFLKTQTQFGFAAQLRRWIERWKAVPAREAEETRARLDFILEMMDTHPEAFASEDAVKSSALYFSGRF